MSDPLHPDHYNNDRFGNSWPSIQLMRMMTFNAGNAMKYIWRHEDKGTPLQDLEKALVYLGWAIEDGPPIWLSATLAGRGRRMLADIAPRIEALHPVYRALINIGNDHLGIARLGVSATVLEMKDERDRDIERMKALLATPPLITRADAERQIRGTIDADVLTDDSYPLGEISG